MDINYKIHQDIYQDAWNWWDACNSINFNTDWSKKVSLEIVKNIKGKSKVEAYKFLIPYLKEKYIIEKKLLEKNRLTIQKEFDNKFKLANRLLVRLMGKPLYVNKIDLFLTTFPSIPYNKEKAYIWINYYWKDPIKTYLHEICHLQFIHYWRENKISIVSRLSEDQFELLKESLTIIIDNDFFPLISSEDSGYPIHKKFRLKLKKNWEKNKNFSDLVLFGVKTILD